MHRLIRRWPIVLAATIAILGSAGAAAAGNWLPAEGRPAAPGQVTARVTGTAVATAAITWAAPTAGSPTGYEIRVYPNDLNWAGYSTTTAPAIAHRVTVKVAGTRVVRAAVRGRLANGQTTPWARSTPTKTELRTQALWLMDLDPYLFAIFKLDQLALPAADRLPFNWTDDSCSGPTPKDFDQLFNEACERHDFGYRNLGKKGLDPTEDRRHRIDDRLRSDAHYHCDRVITDRKSCHEFADYMYRAVRAFGSSAYQP